MPTLFDRILLNLLQRPAIRREVAAILNRGEFTGELLEALKSVRSIIADAAMTGFNHADGDWAERLFASQRRTSAAVKKAETA